MKKAGVVLAPGFEESETLYIVDVLRRCGIVCELTGWSEWVEGAHGIVVKADRLFDENDFSDTILILPGGYIAVDFMLENEALCAHLKERNRRGLWIGAMCAAPAVLDVCHILEGRKFTAYQGYEKKIQAQGFVDDIVVEDGNLITSRGPACAMHFAFAIADRFNENGESVKKRMLFDHTFPKEGQK